jgi:hypothetical protein
MYLEGSLQTTEASFFFFKQTNDYWLLKLMPGAQFKLYIKVVLRVYFVVHQSSNESTRTSIGSFAPFSQNSGFYYTYF